MVDISFLLYLLLDLNFEKSDKYQIAYGRQIVIKCRIRVGRYWKTKLPRSPVFDLILTKLVLMNGILIKL